MRTSAGRPGRAARGGGGPRTTPQDGVAGPMTLDSKRPLRVVVAEDSYVVREFLTNTLRTGFIGQEALRAFLVPGFTAHPKRVMPPEGFAAYDCF